MLLGNIASSFHAMWGRGISPSRTPLLAASSQVTPQFTQISTPLHKSWIRPWNVYRPFSGVTTNQFKSFNATLKWLQKWCEVPVDTICIVLTLYHLQAYFCNEIQRRLAGRFWFKSMWNHFINYLKIICFLTGLRNYKLFPHHKAASWAPHELGLLKCYHPEEIVDRIHDRLEKNASLSTDSSMHSEVQQYQCFI